MLVGVLAAFSLAASVQEPAELLEQNRPAEAVRVLTNELRTHPDDVRSLMLMGIALDGLKRYEEAEPYYRRALKLAPAHPAVLNNAGNHYVAAGKPAEARRAFERVVAAEPHHANANLQLAQLAAGEKKGAEVLRCLDRLPAADRNAFGVRLLRARALAWTGQAEPAAQLLAALESEPQNDPRAESSLGLALAEARLYEKAEAAFSRALASSPGDRDVLYNLGLAAIGARHFGRAVEVLEAALRQKPDDVDALYALARAHAEGGNNEMALIPLIAARKAAPKRTDVLEFIGHVSDALGYYGDAAAAYDEFLRIEPGNDVVRRERGFCRVRANRLEEGIGDLEWYAARHPKDAAGLFQLAIAESVRDPQKALTRLNAVLELKPGYMAALFARGAMYLTLNRPSEAIPDLEHALERDPDNVRALDRLGQAWLRLDRPEKALGPLARAAQRAPGDTKVLTHYSQALRFTGREAEARTVLARFRQIPEEMRRVPNAGIVEFLSLPPEEQRERYFEGLQKSVRINETNPDLHMRLGHELLARNRIPEALEAYRRAVSLDSGPKRAAEIARRLIDREQWTAAREFLLPVAETSRLDLAIATFHAVSPEAGLAELDKIPAAERHGDFYLLRAQILDGLGRKDDAIAALNAGFRASPTRVELYLGAARFLFKHAMHREALELLDQAIQTLPDAPQLRLSRAMALELARRGDDALRELAAIQSRWPEWDKTYLLQGIILNVARKPAEARKALETAIAMGANTSEAYYFLALSIYESAPEDVPPARQAIAAALALNANDPYLRALAGKFAQADGDYKTAVVHFQEAVRLFPDYFQAHYNLATLYRELGEEDKAMAEMKQVRRVREGHTKEELEIQAPPIGDVLPGIR